ncbi:MAG: anti-sigma F factor [Ruminococcaceae bacterium]|nr:anti-sigma F factor [Oscillospiraceae bacterium]
MKTENSMKLEFISRSANESFARVSCACFVSQLDPTLEELSDVKTAVSEAVTNAIVHGYRDTLGKITVTAKLCPKRRIIITVKDVGVGIENIDAAREPFYTGDSSGERSGMGFAIMETLMDKVSVRSRPGKGTTVTMEKTFAARAKI